LQALRSEKKGGKRGGEGVEREAHSTQQRMLIHLSRYHFRSAYRSLKKEGGKEKKRKKREERRLVLLLLLSPLFCGGLAERGGEKKEEARRALMWSFIFACACVDSATKRA